MTVERGESCEKRTRVQSSDRASAPVLPVRGGTVLLRLRPGFLRNAVRPAGVYSQSDPKNFDFEACGFFMLAAFDTDPDKIDTQVGPVHIMDAMHLRRFIQAEAPSMAVLTVPRENAVEAADLLATGGVGAIWDFTGCDLGLEDRNVTVERVNLADSLLTLSYRLERRRDEKAAGSSAD